MAATVRIKRSATAGNPAVLAAGELAYSSLADSGANGGDRLYIGTGTETTGNAANHEVIGGKYFVSIINAATDANTASTLVKRDVSGNFTAGTITAALTGNASTATTLATARTINGTSFNGSANITITASTTNALTIGTGLSGTSFDGGSAVTIAIDTGTTVDKTTAQTLTNKSFSDSTTFFIDQTDASKKLQFELNGITTATIRTLTVPNVDGTIITSGDTATVTNTMLAGSIANTKLLNSSVTVGTTAIALGASSTTLAGLTSVSSTGFTGALTGNASTATTLAVGRTIAITGDLAYTSPSFDGSGNVTASGTLATVNSTVGTFGAGGTIPVVTVNAKGLVTSVTTVAVSAGTLSIAGTTGTDNLTVGTDTLTFAGGTGVTTTVTNNQVSIAIGQAVSTTSNVTFNDLVVSGNLTISGTTTSVNTATLDVADLNITVAKNAVTAAAANGAGLTVAGPTTPATFTYTSADDRWNLNKNLNVTTVFGALSGNATTATTLATGRTIAITGDLTYTSPSFDGSGNVTAASTLATVNANVGSFGSGTSVATFTVNGKGLITAAGITAIPTATSSVQGLASFSSTDFLVTTGSVTIASVDGGTY